MLDVLSSKVRRLRSGLLQKECHPELGSGGGCIYYNEYDAAGNVVEKTDGDTVYHYSYDRAKRLTRVESTRGGVTHTERELFYGTANDGTNRKLGKLETAVGHNYWDSTNPIANVPISETYEYRGLGGAVSKRTTEFMMNPNGASIVQEFTWSQLGQLKSQKYPILTPVQSPTEPIGESRTVSNSYTWGWLSGVQGYTATDGFRYHKNGMLYEVEHSNGVIDTYEMDDASMQRPKRITVSGPNAGTWSTGDISYDGAGNITAMGSDWFLYDGISRLTQAHLADVDRDGVSDAVDIAYRYDPFGNRTDTFWSDTDEQGGVTTSWYTTSVDAATNRLLGEAYDSKGNMTSLHGDTFTWYPFNQLQTRAGTGRNLIYGYTVDGERFLALDLTATPAHFTLTVRDLDGKVVSEFAVDAEIGIYTWEKDYIYANGKLLATVDDTHTRHHHLDHLGTPRVITDASGNRIAYNAYSPYGLQLTGETNERHKFTGHERDPGNLDYMHARYYSPAVARFLSVDPEGGKTGGSLSWNRFLYAKDNPLLRIDPDGLKDMVYIIQTLSFFQQRNMEDLKENIESNTKYKVKIINRANSDEIKETLKTSDSNDIVFLLGHSNGDGVQTNEGLIGGTGFLESSELGEAVGDGSPPQSVVVAGCSSSPVAEAMAKAGVSVAFGYTAQVPGTELTASGEAVVEQLANESTPEQAKQEGEKQLVHTTAEIDIFRHEGVE